MLQNSFNLIVNNPSVFTIIKKFSYFDFSIELFLDYHLSSITTRFDYDDKSCCFKTRMLCTGIRQSLFQHKMGLFSDYFWFIAKSRVSLLVYR